MPNPNDILRKYGAKPVELINTIPEEYSSRSVSEGNFYNAGRSSDFESGYQNFLYKNQFFGEGALKAIGGGAIDGLLGAAEGIVNFPKIFTQDWEKNGLQQGISDVRESWKDIIKLAHPSDSEGHFDDMGDFWEGLQSAVSSGIEFAIPGGIISKTVSGVGKLASTIGKAALKLNTTAKAIRTAEILGKTGWESAGEVTKWLSYIGENQVASRIGSAVMSNLHEGTVMGLQKYEEVKKKAYEDFKQIGLSDEESLTKAKEIAAQAAEDVVDANKYFWVSNLITLSPFFKGATEVTNPSLLKSLSKEFADFGDAVKNQKYKNLFHNGITGAVGEGLQEMIQNVIEHSAENTANKTIDSILTKAGAEKKYNAVDNDFGSYVDRFFSKDALYEGIVGFGSAPIIGGAGKLINNKLETNFTVNPAFAKFEKATGLKMTERNYESAIQSADDEIKNLQKNLTKENSIKIKEIEEAKSELENKLLNTQVGAYDVSQSFDVADTVTQVIKNFKSLTTDIAGVDDSTQQVAKDNEFYKLIYRARRLGKLDEIKDQIQSTDDKVTSTQLLEKIDKFEKISSYNSGKFFGDILTGNQITRDIYFDYKNRNNNKINELLTKISTQIPGITANYTDGNFTFSDKDGNNIQLNDQQSELVRNIKSDNDNIYTLDAANKATDVKLNHTLKTDAIYRNNETERIFKSAVSNLQNNPEQFIDDYNKFVNFENESTSKLEKEIKKQESLINEDNQDEATKLSREEKLKEDKVKLANLKDKNFEIQNFRANVLKPYKDLYDVKEFQKEVAKKAAEQSVEVTDSTINFEDLIDTFDINNDNPESNSKEDIKENDSFSIKFGNEILEVVGDSSVINLGQEFGTILETLPNEQGINKVSKTKNNGIQVNGFFNGKTVTIKKETYKSGGIEDKTSYNIYITTKDGEFYIGKLKTDKIPDELLNILNTQNVETQLIVDSKYRIETGKETSFDDFLNKHKEKQSNVKFKVISVNEKNDQQTLLNGNIEEKVGKHNIVNYDTLKLHSNVPHILLNVGNHPDTGEPVYYAKMLKFKQQKLHTDLAKTLNNIFFVLYSLKMSDKENLPKRFAIYKKLIDNGFVDVSHLEKESALLKDFLSKYNADTTSAEEIEAFLNEFKPSILYYQTYIHTFLKTYKTSEQPTDKNFILQLLPATDKSSDGFERILVTNTENGKKYAITFNGDPSTVEKFFKENGPSDWEKMFSNLRLPFLRPGEIKTVPILSEELPIGELDTQDINTFAWLTDLNGRKKEQLVFPVIGVKNVNQVDPINNLGIAKRNKDNLSEYITPQGPATRSSVYLNGESNGKQSAAMNAGTIVDSLFKSLFAGLTFQQAYDKLTNDIGPFPMNVAEKIFNALNDKKLNFGNNTKIITKTKDGNDLTFIYKAENQLVAGELDAILEHIDPKTGLKTYSILDLKTSKKDTPDLENYRKQQEFFALAIKEYLNLDYIPEMYIAYAQVEYDKIDTPAGEDVNSGTLSIKNISTHKIEPTVKQTEQVKSTQSAIELNLNADLPQGKVGNTNYEVKGDNVYFEGKKIDNPENKTHRQLIEADIEKEVLGSFANTIQRIVNSKGPSNGKTIRTELTSKISSDGEVIVFKSKNTFADDGRSVISSPASMTIEEFKEHFYPMLTADEIEMFEETLEVYKKDGWNGRIFFKELRVGSSKATNLKGQLNLDIMIGMGNDYGFTLTKKLTDTELDTLENKQSEPNQSEIEAKKVEIVQTNKPTIQTIGNVTFGTANKQGQTDSNEDAVYVDTQNGVFILADGMGGEGMITHSPSQTSKSVINKLLGKPDENATELLYNEYLKNKNITSEEAVTFLNKNGFNIKGVGITMVSTIINSFKTKGDLTNKKGFRTGATALKVVKTGKNTYIIEKVGDTVYFVVDKNGKVTQSHGLSSVATTQGYMFSIKEGKPYVSTPKIDSFTVTLNEGETLVLATDFIETDKAIQDFIDSDFGKNLNFEEFQKNNKRDDSTFITIEYDAELKALKQQHTTSNKSEIEAKKADIERRRQEVKWTPISGGISFEDFIKDNKISKNIEDFLPIINLLNVKIRPAIKSGNSLHATSITNKDGSHSFIIEVNQEEFNKLSSNQKEEYISHELIHGILSYYASINGIDNFNPIYTKVGDKTVGKRDFTKIHSLPLFKEAEKLRNNILNNFNKKSEKWFLEKGFSNHDIEVLNKRFNAIKTQTIEELFTYSLTSSQVEKYLEITKELNNVKELLKDGIINAKYDEELKALKETSNQPKTETLLPNLIYGTPGIGKTTYVTEKKDENIVDVDDLLVKHSNSKDIEEFKAKSPNLSEKERADIYQKVIDEIANNPTITYFTGSKKLIPYADKLYLKNTKEQRKFVDDKFKQEEKELINSKSTIIEIQDENEFLSDVLTQEKRLQEILNDNPELTIEQLEVKLKEYPIKISLKSFLSNTNEEEYQAILLDLGLNTFNFPEIEPVVTYFELYPGINPELQTKVLLELTSIFPRNTLEMSKLYDLYLTILESNFKYYEENNINYDHLKPLLNTTKDTFVNAYKQIAKEQFGFTFEDENFEKQLSEDIQNFDDYGSLTKLTLDKLKGNLKFKLQKNVLFVPIKKYSENSPESKYPLLGIRESTSDFDLFMTMIENIFTNVRPDSKSKMELLKNHPDAAVRRLYDYLEKNENIKNGLITLFDHYEGAYKIVEYDKNFNTKVIPINTARMAEKLFFKTIDDFFNSGYFTYSDKLEDRIFDKKTASEDISYLIKALENIPRTEYDTLLEEYDELQSTISKIISSPSKEERDTLPTYQKRRKELKNKIDSVSDLAYQKRLDNYLNTKYNDQFVSDLVEDFFTKKLGLTLHKNAITVLATSSQFGSKKNKRFGLSDFLYELSNYTKGENPLTETAFRNAETKGMFFYEKSFLRFAINEQIKYTAISGSRVIKSGDRPISTQLAHNNISRVIRDYTGLDEYSLENMQKALKSRFKKRSLLLKSLIEYFTQLKNSPTAKEDMTKFLSVIPFSLEPLKRENSSRQNKNKELDKLSEEELMFIEKAMFFDQNWPSFSSPTLSDKKTKYIIHSAWLKRIWKEYSVNVKTLNGVTYPIDFLNLLFDEQLNAELDRYLYNNSKKAKEKKNSFFYINEYLNYSFLENNPNKELIISLYRQETGEDITDLIGNNQEKILNTHFIWNNVNGNKVLNTDLANPNSKAYKLARIIFEVEFINHSNKEQSLSKQYSTHAEIAYRLNKLSLVQLIHGDPANAFKNAKNDIDIVKETLINYEKRLAKDNASGTPYVYDEDPNDVIRILPINDLKLPVNDLDKRLEVLNGKETMDKFLLLAEKAETTKNFVTIYKSSKGLKRQIALANILKNSSKELTKNIIGLEYTSVNTTDAGSFITPGFALKKLFRSGKISKLFYDNAIEAFNNDPYSFNLVNFIKTSSNLRSAELTAKNISPEKPITVGEIQDNLIEDVRSYYEKEAEFLLDPTELASTPILQKIYELLINSGADKAAPPSAIKLGVEDVNPTFDINEDGEIEIVDEVIIEPIEVHWKYYNKQVETPIDEESETEITTVTQIMTQIISNVDPKNKKLVSKYLKNVRELYDLKKEALKNNLLIPGSNTVDRRKLAEYIKKLADKKILRISDNALFHLFQIKNNKFETPLYALDEKSYMEISGALNAMLRKELKTHLFTGSANYLRPDVGITKTNLYDSVDKFQGDISYISGYELQEDGLQPNEMIISWDYVDSLGNRVPIEDFLNKDGTLSNRFPKELLETLSMRIPNTGHNSTSVMKIIGFTKQANTVITHNSLIAQMGSDFDIDKLYSYVRPFTYIDKDLKPLTKSNLHQFVNEPKYELLKIKAVERDIIDSMVDIMDLPEIQRETMIPLNFGKLKNIADNTVENKATFLSSKYDRENYLNSTGAKTMVGIFANSLSFYTVLEQNDKKLKLFKKNKEGEPIDFEFYINGIKTNGTLGLTNTLSNSNRKVTTVLKSMLQSAVDNQKENILGKLNINKHTASVINLLAYLGYEEDAIVSIINKPIIREFVTDLNNKKSIFSKEALSDSKILSEKIKTLENILKTETDNKDNHDFYRKIENDLSELKKYAYLLSYADDLQEITIGVNIFSKGVPLDPFDNYDQLSSFERVLSKSPFNPISPLKIYFEDEEGLGSLLKIGDDLNLLGITYENHLKESASIFNESDLYPEILNKRFVQFAEDINPYINKKAILKNIRAYVLAQKFNLAEEKPKSLTNISFIFDKLFLFQNNDYVFNVIKELKFLQNLSFTKEYQSNYRNLVYANRFDSEVLKQHRRELNTLLTNKDKIVENRFTKEPLMFDDKPLTYGDLAQELIKYAIFAEQTFSYFNVYSLLDTAILDQVGLNENFKDEVYKALYDESFEINFVANNPNLIRKADSFEDEETLKYLMINNKIQNRDGLIIQPLPVPRNSLDYQHVKNKLVDPKPTLKDKLALMKNNKKYKSLYDLLSALQEKGIFEDLNIEVNTNSRTRLSANTLFYNPIQEDQQTGTQYVQFIHEHLHHFLKKVLTKEFENSIEYQNVFNSFFNDKVRIGNKNQTLEEYLRDKLAALKSQENRNEKEENLKVILDNIFKHPLKNNILNEYLTSLVTVDQLTDELSDSPFYKKIIDHIKELLGKLFDYLSTKSARYNNFIVERDLKPLAELYIKSNKILPEVKETLPEVKNSGNIFNQSEFSDLETDGFSFPNIEKQQEFENFFIEQLEADPTLTETEILNQFKNCH